MVGRRKAALSGQLLVLSGQLARSSAVALCSLLAAFPLLLTVGCDHQAEIDRQWAVDQADLAERVVPQQTDTLSRLLTTEWGALTVLNVGRVERAEIWARELVEMAKGHETDMNYGGAIHGGNVILGRIALIRGDRETAKEHLLAAGKTPGSPSLRSFGPNMSLARDLLAAGETECVLAYFDQCDGFWKTGADKLAEWRRAVRGGEMPHFGANLAY